MEYGEYIKQKLNEARKNEWFDEGGSNSTATVNRSFFSEVMRQMGWLNSDIACCIDVKELLEQLKCVLFIASLPITYIPSLFLRAHFARKRARKEMMHYYERDTG